MVNMESKVAAEGSTRPAVEKSRRRVVYRQPAWSVRQWTVEAGGTALCRCAALRVSGGLLLWVGAGGGATQLGAVALGVPGGAGGGGALATLLAAGEGEGERAAGLARRLAAALRRPVHVCCSAPLDRFTAPLLERALIAEIKSRPEFFSD